MAKALKLLRLIEAMFFLLIILVILLPVITLSSCNKNNKTIEINLYNTETNKIEKLNLENYIEGVVAGEISNTAPLESLKAQAVLARSFTLYFLNNNKSKYEGADISTDILEAQAYNKNNINENIKKAVKETKNIVLTYNNDYINTWFHSNSGGETTTAKTGLSFLGEEPKYLKQIKTTENNSNTKNFNWSATFTKSEILNTLRSLGLNVSTISKFNKGEISNDGRCITFNIGGKFVNSNSFRLNIGSTKMKSTLIDKIIVNENSITFEGRGYGHGVGLSQEYSIILANQGLNYKEIINNFYKDIEFKVINK